MKNSDLDTITFTCNVPKDLAAEVLQAFRKKNLHALKRDVAMRGCNAVTSLEEEQERVVAELEICQLEKRIESCLRVFAESLGLKLVDKMPPLSLGPSREDCTAYIGTFAVSNEDTFR